jgi:hypothetical protein
MNKYWPSFLDTRRGSECVFRYVLVEAATGEPHDPAVLVTAVRNLRVGETLDLGDGSQARILGIETNIDAKLVDLGFEAVLAVGPVHGARPKRRGWRSAMQTRRRYTIGSSTPPPSRGLRWAWRSSSTMVPATTPLSVGPAFALSFLESATCRRSRF